MFDYESQTEAVRSLIDDAAFHLFNGALSQWSAFREMDTHRRQTKRGYAAEVEEARGMGKSAGIEMAVARLLGVGRTEVRRAVYARAQELYGPAEGWRRA